MKSVGLNRLDNFPFLYPKRFDLAIDYILGSTDIAHIKEGVHIPTPPKHFCTHIISMCVSMCAFDGLRGQAGREFTAISTPLTNSNITLCVCFSAAGCGLCTK